MYRYKCLVAILVLILLHSTIYSQSQQKVNSPELIKQAKEHFAKNKYKEAISAFQKIPQTDTNYQLALINLSYLYYVDSNYISAEKAALEGLKFYPDKADEFYNLLANSLDGQGKYNEALATYDKVIAKYNNAYMPLYNKGITYLTQKNYKEAKKAFEKSLLINPYYAASHFYMGNIAYEEGNMVAAILSYTTNLLVSPDNKYSNSSVKMLASITKVSDEVAKKANTYKAGSTDNFETVQEILLSKVALDKQYKLKADLEEPTVRQLQAILEKISFDNSDKGFWMQYYVPFYETILKQDRFEPFVFHIFSNLSIPAIEQYVKRNKKKIETILPFTIEYFNEIRATQTLAAADRKNVTKRIFYSNNTAFGKGETTGEGKKEMLTGPWEFYHDNGIIKSKGSFNDKQEKTGDWSFYYDNGQLKEKTSFVNNKPEGKSVDWFDNGALKNEGQFKDGQVEGKSNDYYYNGALKSSTSFKAGKKEGPVKFFTNYGTTNYSGAFANDKEDGDFTYYFKNGKVANKVTYKNEQPVGVYKSYFLDGAIKIEGNFVDGKRSGQWKEYHNNGKIKSIYNYTTGGLDGEYKDFYDNGNPQATTTYSKDKIEGKYEDFDYDGKLFSESMYEKGRVREMKFFDKQGKVISSSSSRNGSGNFVFFDPEGNKTSEGYFTKEGLRNGKGTYYYRNGKIKAVGEYKDGMLNGERISYFLNGNIQSKLIYKDDEEHGYQVRYHSNGKIREEGEVVKGTYDGLHIEYDQFGNVENKTFYFEGDANGLLKYYHPNGKLDFEQYYRKGWIVGLTQYDTTGKVISDNDFTTGKSPVIMKKYNGKPFVQCTYTNYLLDGEHRLLNIDGSPKQIQFYKKGFKDSTYKRFYYGGQVDMEGTYKMGEKDGKWTSYHENGQLNYTEVYNNGRLNGVTSIYNAEGNLERELPYKEGDFDGEYKFYGENKQVAAVLYYQNGTLRGYSYLDNTGKLIPMKPLKNASGTVTAFYQNGTKSVEIDFDNNEINGKRNLYFSTGKPYVLSNRIYGEDHGVSKFYYSNGNLRKEEVNHYDNLHGLVKKYWPNGKIQSEENWYNGDLHGVTKKYDNTGKLVNTINYYFGSQEAIK